MAGATQISAAEAIKFFKSASVTVQTARQVKVKGEDGVLRPAFKTENAPLAEGLILSAADYGDRVSIVTIDGKRHEAPKK